MNMADAGEEMMNSMCIDAACYKVCNYHSFGGWKASVFGDHGIYGMEGVRFYTKLKTITARWPTGIRAGAEFNFRARA